MYYSLLISRGREAKVDQKVTDIVWDKGSTTLHPREWGGHGSPVLCWTLSCFPRRNDTNLPWSPLSLCPQVAPPVKDSGRREAGRETDISEHRNLCLFFCLQGDKKLSVFFLTAFLLKQK